MQSVFGFIGYAGLHRPGDQRHGSHPILRVNAFGHPLQRQAPDGFLARRHPEKLAQRAQNTDPVGIDVPIVDRHPAGRQRQGQPLLRHHEALFALHHGPRRITANGGHLDVRIYARQQLARGERFGQVIIRRRVERLNLGFFAGPRRQHQHRRAGERGIAPDTAQHAKAVELRHHHVSQHQIRRPHARRRQRGLAILDRIDIVTLGDEQSSNVVAHVGIVVGQQHALAKTSKLLARQSLGRSRRLDNRIRRPGDVAGRRKHAQGFFNVGIHLGRGLRRCCLTHLVRRQMRRSERKLDREDGAAAGHAIRSDGAAMQLDQFLHQREADAGAFETAALRAFDPMEALEQSGQLLGRNADTGIGDANARLASFATIDQ